jgi:hypothetical protein
MQEMRALMHSQVCIRSIDPSRREDTSHCCLVAPKTSIWCKRLVEWRDGSWHSRNKRRWEISVLQEND